MATTQKNYKLESQMFDVHIWRGAMVHMCTKYEVCTFNPVAEEVCTDNVNTDANANTDFNANANDDAQRRHKMGKACFKGSLVDKPNEKN